MRVEVDGPVSRVTIDRPSTRNALSPEVVNGLETAMDATEASGCSVLVLRGSGGSVSSGADLTYLLSQLDDPAAVRAYITSIGRALDRLEAAPFVSVCVLDGYALAGGCEILLACDLAVVSDRSRIGDRHLEYGLLPGAGGSVRLTRALPAGVARTLLYTGDMIDGREAERLGLVAHVAPAEDLESTADTLVDRLARHDPDALLMMKRLHLRAATIDPAQAIDAERETLLAHLAGAPAREGLHAFAERRAPRFDRARERSTPSTIT